MPDPAAPVAPIEPTRQNRADGYGFAKKSASVDDIANTLAERDHYGLHKAARAALTARATAHGAVEDPPPSAPASRPQTQGADGLRGAVLSQDTPPDDTDPPPSSESTQDTEQIDTSAGVISSLSDLAQALDTDMETLLEMRAATKVDGQDTAVTLREALSSFRQQGHITRQTQEIAKERDKQRAEYQAKVAALDEQLAKQTTALELSKKVFLKEIDKVEWDKLRAEDTQEFILQRFDWEKKREVLNEAIAEHTAMLEQRAAERSTAAKEWERGQYEQLMEKAPEMGDATHATKVFKQISDYMVTRGFASDDIKTVSDHRHFMVLKDAAAYHALRAQGGPRNTIVPSTATPTLRTAPRPVGIPAQTKALEKARAALRKDGSPEAAAAVMAAKRAQAARRK